MIPDSHETEELLNQVRQGQAAATGRLLDEHREPLRRMISLRLDPALAARVDASDVVQEVLLEANRRLQDYLRAPTMPFQLWLRQLARDHIIDAYRRHHLAQRRSVDREQRMLAANLCEQSSIELAGQLMDHELTPASAAIQHEMERRLHAALGELDEDDREIILMKHYEQVSNQDMAAFLGLTEAASSMRYLRALRRLKALLVPEKAD